jgi:hypothetical protein
LVTLTILIHAAIGFGSDGQSSGVVCAFAPFSSPVSWLARGKIRYDSPGTDRGSKTSLNAEYVVIKNTGTTTRSLTGWTVRDKAHHVYTFPSFKLKPGKSVKLHSGKGSNTSSNLYWDRGWYVWNNDGDKAILRSSSGTLTDTCTWGDGIGYKNC